MKIILIGPGGAGKSTLEKKLSSELGINRVISTTSRQIRKGETNHVDYHFISEKEFEEMIIGKRLLEYIKIYNDYYGTALEDFNVDCVAVLDVDSAKFVEELYNDAIIIYLACPSEICKNRIILRDGEVSLDNHKLVMRSKQTKSYFVKFHIPVFL